MLTDTFDVTELLVRVTQSDRPNLWRLDGTLSSAAFKDSKGVSVTRSGGRSLSETLCFMKPLFPKEKRMASVSVQDCNSLNLYLKYLPTDDNAYHSEIHRSKDKIELTQSQARKLSKLAKLHNVD